MCHDPSLPLEGVTPGLLLNFSTSRKCHMTPATAEDAAMMVCGCHGEDECNDQLIFQKGANGEKGVGGSKGLKWGWGFKAG